MSQTKSGDEKDYSIILVCEVRANPIADLQFVWTHQNSTLNESMAESVMKQDGAKSWIEIPTRSPVLYGKWTCSVSNSVGATERNCTTLIEGPIRKYGVDK